MGKELLVRIFELGLYYDYNRVIDLYNYNIDILINSFVYIYTIRIIMVMHDSSIMLLCEGTKDQSAGATDCTAKVLYCTCMRTWTYGGGVFRC